MKEIFKPRCLQFMRVQLLHLPCHLLREVQWTVEGGSRSLSAVLNYLHNCKQRVPHVLKVHIILVMILPSGETFLCEL